VGARFFAQVQTGLGDHPASRTMGLGSFPWVKRPGRDADHTPRSKHRGHETVEFYLCLLSGPVQACNGTALPLHFTPRRRVILSTLRLALIERWSEYALFVLPSFSGHVTRYSPIRSKRHLSAAVNDIRTATDITSHLLSEGFVWSNTIDSILQILRYLSISNH
jgi:hypothetical protein